MGFWTACNIFHFLELTDFDWLLMLTQPFAHELVSRKQVIYPGS